MAGKELRFEGEALQDVGYLGAKILCEELAAISEAIIPALSNTASALENAGDAIANAIHGLDEQLGDIKKELADLRGVLGRS